MEIFQINQKLSLQPTDVDFIAESSPQNCLTVLSEKTKITFELEDQIKDLSLRESKYLNVFPFIAMQKTA